MWDKLQYEVTMELRVTHLEWNDGCLATSEGTTKKISEFQVPAFVSTLNSVHNGEDGKGLKLERVGQRFQVWEPAIYSKNFSNINMDSFSQQV